MIAAPVRVGWRRDRRLGNVAVMVPVFRQPFAIAVLAWLACTLGAGAAHAQDDVGADTPPEAIEYFRQAREHYEAGAYREAAESLERALVLDPESPTLVFNLARVYELLGDLPRSLQYYEHYQQLLPQQQAREQERAAATIRRLQGAAQSSDFQAETPQEVAPLMQLPGIVLVRENGVADLAFWLALSTGAVSLAAGGVFGGLVLSARSSANTFGDAQTYGILADVTFGLGGALVVAAVLLYFSREHTVERAPIRAGGHEEGGGESGSADEGAGEDELDAPLAPEPSAQLMPWISPRGDAAGATLGMVF